MSKPDQTSEREAFETWARDNGYDTDHPIQPDEYHMASTQDAWEVWQARAAVPALVQPEPSAIPAILPARNIGVVCPTAPERIWLQVDPEPEEEGTAMYPENAGRDDVTWCADQINANDTLYIRADLAASASLTPPAPSDWWCPHCQCAVLPEHVTYDERHDIMRGGCGEHVSSAAPAPPSLTADRVRAIANECGMFDDYYENAPGEHCDRFAAAILVAAAPPSLPETVTLSDEQIEDIAVDADKAYMADRGKPRKGWNHYFAAALLAHIGKRPAMSRDEIMAKAARWHDENTLGGEDCEHRQLELVAYVEGYSAALSTAPAQPTTEGGQQ